MTPVELKRRTKLFALQIILLVGKLPRTYTAEVLGRQVTRSATSVGANYRAACRARSSADFIAKMKIVEEEADETMYWLELLHESGIVSESTVREVLNEANEIVAIVVASIKTKRTQT